VKRFILSRVERLRAQTRRCEAGGRRSERAAHKPARTPPSKHARCGYTLRQSRLADIGRIHLGARLPLILGHVVSLSPKEACVGTLDGACTWREGERVNESVSRSPNDLDADSRVISSEATRKRHGGTRSRSSSACASKGREQCDLRLLGSESVQHPIAATRVGSRQAPRVGEDGSPGVPRGDSSSVRGWDNLGNGRSSSEQTSAVGQHPRR